MCQDCQDCNGITLLKGNDGRGIVSITDNNNGTLTILYTDGTFYVTPDFTGPTGATGNALVGKWKFDTTTTVGPANTFIRFNNATIGSVTKIYISKIDVNDITKEDYLFSFQNIASTNSGDINKFGIITLFELVNINNYISFEIKDVIDQTTYMELDVVLMSNSVSFTANLNIGTYFTPSEQVVETTLYPISNWNMDSSNLFNLPHNLTDFTKIIAVEVVIQNDLVSALNPLNSFNGTSVQGGVYQIDSTNIVLMRLTGGLFDASAWSGSGNRGYALVKYLK